MLGLPYFYLVKLSRCNVEYDDVIHCCIITGSYDGRVGQIVNTCQDNEAIEKGQPGAVMYDQNIRET